MRIERRGPFHNVDRATTLVKRVLWVPIFLHQLRNQALNAERRQQWPPTFTYT
jgi:hypothetical protein